MYEYLEGRVAGRSPARLVLDVHGVGYELVVPAGMAFPSTEKLRVFTHFVVREDSQQLFGFPDASTRDLFRALLGVRGVGPAMATAVLAGLSRDDLIAAIASGDSKRLCTVKGVGKRTADQILLDLGDKAAELAALHKVELSTEKTNTLQPQKAPRIVTDAVAALVSLGYADAEAEAAVARARTKVKKDDLELLVRTAMRA